MQTLPEMLQQQEEMSLEQQGLTETDQLVGAKFVDIDTSRGRASTLAEANRTLESLGNEEVAAVVASSPNRTLQAGQLSALQNYKLLKTALIEQAEKRHEQNQRRFERLQAK